jgi:hypothetical protein
VLFDPAEPPLPPRAARALLDLLTKAALKKPATGAADQPGTPLTIKAKT